MNPWEECLKQLASFFQTVAAITFVGTFIEPLLHGDDILTVHPANLFYGLAGAVVFMLLSFFVLHQRKP